MLALAAKLHELTGTAASRTVAQLRELGVEPACRSATITVTIAPFPSRGQQLMATTCDRHAAAARPARRAGHRRSPRDRRTRARGRPRRQAAAGGRKRQRPGLLDRNRRPHPRDGSHRRRRGLGGRHRRDRRHHRRRKSDRPLAGAALTAAEAFKWAFGAIYPERAALLEMTPWRGAFSFFSYGLDRVSPPIRDIRIAATLVGWRRRGRVHPRHDRARPPRVRVA